MNHLVKYGHMWQIRWLAKMMASAPATDNNELLVLRVRILSEIERGEHVSMQIKASLSVYSYS